LKKEAEHILSLLQKSDDNIILELKTALEKSLKSENLDNIRKIIQEIDTHMASKGNQIKEEILKNLP